MNRRNLLLLFGICALLTICALMIVYGTSDARNGSKKEKLLTYLKHISGLKTISGLSVTKSENDWNKDFETIKNITGFYPGILLTQMPNYTDGVDTWHSFINKTIHTWSDGYLVHLHWGYHGNPLTAMNILKEGDESNWNDLITDGGYLNNVWKKELDTLATYLHQLEIAGVVPICDILSVINYADESIMWRSRSGLNGSLKLYQLTHDYLTKRHRLNSLIWVWSIYVEGDMTQLEDYWPGNHYVDVASVYLLRHNQLTTTQYQELLNVVGGKLIAMELMTTIPTPELLVSQPQWTWFTLYDEDLTSNSDQAINATFKSPFVINREQNEFFKMLKE